MKRLTSQEQKRLKELARRCVEGELAGAELELYGWCRAGEPPAAARVMLAALLARRGKYEQARAVLCAIDGQGMGEVDALELQTIISLLVAMDYTDAAKRLSRLLYEAHGDRAVIRQWLMMMSVPGYQDLPAEPQSTVEGLVDALAAEPELIVSLVYAEKLEPQRRSVALLREAVGRVAEQMRGGEGFKYASVCLSMAELANLAGDAEDARQWAHQGLKADPYNAGLALVLSRMGDDLSVGPAAATVLSEVAKKHPDYRDVQAALIRREGIDGKHASAKRRLALWLKREPECELALRLKEELAA